MNISKKCRLRNALRNILSTDPPQTYDLFSVKVKLISPRQRYYYASSTAIRTKDDNKESTQDKHLLKIAIVGGGATGLSAALHLAPLVDRGILAKPIQLYETKSLSHFQNHSRTIGVGLWSTALLPFTQRTTYHHPSNSWKIRPTHAQVIRNLEHFGTYLKDVGYRTPDGNWLVQGSLNYPSLSSKLDKDEDINVDHVSPSLLFIRECDFLQTLRDAVSREELDYGTIKTHYGTEHVSGTTDGPTSLGSCSKVVGIHIPTWSEYQRTGTTDDPYKPLAGQLIFENDELSEPFHLIIAADGMNSILRQKYGGYPASDMYESDHGRKMIDFSSFTNNRKKDVRSIAIEDRNYTVFRGNTSWEKPDGSMEDTVNFQTWGEGKSMRFAAVNMSYPVENIVGNITTKDTLSNRNLRKQTQVWFATTSDKNICNEKDPVKQKEMLLQAFSNWHDPVERLIQSTPVENIIVERGIAHKHSVNQVFNLLHILRTDFSDEKTVNEPALGPGPALLFTGDACMTVDPVLAQGFTMGMESASSLASCIERCYTMDQNGENSINIKMSTLQRELLARQSQRYDRIMCVLRATDLVQSLAQPNRGLSGYISRKILRPLFKITPSFIKKGILMRTIKYSLGILKSSRKEF